MFAYINHTRIRSWNEPVLINEDKVSCSRKKQEPLMGLESRLKFKFYLFYNDYENKLCNLRFQKCTKGYIWSLYVHYVYLLIS